LDLDNDELLKNAEKKFKKMKEKRKQRRMWKNLLTAKVYLFLNDYEKEGDGREFHEWY